MSPSKILPFLLLPLLVACSDQRVSYEIKESQYSLTLIRVTNWPWDKTAKYDIVAQRMPDCMRRHSMSQAPLNSAVEVYSPGNDAWILKQDGRLFVTETRTCEGFAPLDKVPESGLGALMGTFEMSKDRLVFRAAPKVEPPPSAVEPVPPAPEPAVPVTPAPAPTTN